jgi:molybdopterin-guanine dinucleotide biosynthesis protein A
MISREYCTGILLAGGKSSRLGFDKGFLQYEGQTLTERALKVLGLFCNKLIISSNKPEYEKFGVERVADILEQNGPMMGIYSSLMASPNKHNLVLPVDNVFVEASYYEYLISKLDKNLAALPFIDSQYFEPLIGYYNKNIVHDMKKMIYQNNLKLPDLLEGIDVLKLPVQVDFQGYNEKYFKSINYTEDLVFLEKSE